MLMQQLSTLLCTHSMLPQANTVLQHKLKAANHTSIILQDKLTAANHTNSLLQDKLTAATQANKRLLVRVAAGAAFIERVQPRLLTAERVQRDAAQLSAKVQKLEAEALTLAQAHTAAAEEARKEKALRAQMEEVGAPVLLLMSRQKKTRVSTYCFSWVVASTHACSV